MGHNSTSYKVVLIHIHIQAYNLLCQVTRNKQDIQFFMTNVGPRFASTTSQEKVVNYSLLNKYQDKLKYNTLWFPFNIISITHEQSILSTSMNKKNVVRCKEGKIKIDYLMVKSRKQEYVKIFCNQKYGVLCAPPSSSCGGLGGPSDPQGPSDPHGPSGPLGPSGPSGASAPS